MAVVVGCLLLEEVLVRTGVLAAEDFPPASEVLRVVVQQLVGGELWSPIGRTLGSAVLGLGIAAACAVPLGILLGSNKVLYHGTRFLVEFLRPIPPVTIIPLAILLFGTSLEMKLLIIVFGCVWPLLIQTYYGVRDVDPVLADAARAYRFGPLQRFWQLVLPTALPYVMTGLRLAANFAVGLSIVSELIGGAPGLGQTIYQAQLAGQRPLMYAVVVLAAALGMVIEGTFRQVERRLLHWHETQRPAVV
ncbi:ABC transporter permease [Streptomyces sp. TP-A0874]|uniref:ABC transporter permease n=1 Tax=Streptomyces sp. TP-A0874 TaxID=549819 RepID=UPI001480ED2C|nr:ABC transporter permease [Streptomyces sp. TP-A0874]